MEKILALSIDTNLFDKMQDNIGSVVLLHSSFNRTVNYLYQGNLFTIAKDSLDNAASTIRISGSDFDEYFSAPAKEMYITKKGLQIKDYWLIDLETAVHWKGKELKFPSNSTILNNNLEIIKNYLRERNQPVWAHAQRVNKKLSINKFEQMMEEILYAETEAVFSAMASQPINTERLNTTKLFGLGRGLTPSGDDIIMGICFIASIPNCPINLDEQLVKWNKMAGIKTNQISAAAIYQASQGIARESIHQFIEALFYSEELDQLIYQLKKVLAIGSSSGSEIVWGMICTIEIVNQRINNHKEDYKWQ